MEIETVKQTDEEEEGMANGERGTGKRKSGKVTHMSYITRKVNSFKLYDA